jgi:hypothetical protein
MTNLGLEWRKKRMKRNERTNYEEECCWSAILKNVKPERIGYETAQIEKGLKAFGIKKELLTVWLLEVST